MLLNSTVAPAADPQRLNVRTLCQKLAKISLLLLLFLLSHLQHYFSNLFQFSFLLMYQILQSKNSSLADLFQATHPFLIIQLFFNDGCQLLRKG